MPPRNNPTARQERLGAELRKMRERAGKTGREAAARIGSNPMQLSHQEAGRGGISEERLRRLAAFYSCDDVALIDALVAMANDRGKGWWEEYRGILPPSALDLTELEYHATFIRTYQVVHVPGLLQTQDYARAVFSFSLSPLSDRDVDALIEHRMRRQAVVAPHSTIPHEAIIHEAALHMCFGGRSVARAQLEHLLEVSEQDNTRVRVMTYGAEGFSGGGNPIMYLGGAAPQLDTAQLDALHGAIFVDAEAQLARYRYMFDRMAEQSLTVEESRELIHRITHEM
jgi:transcriptional regulator with XRE-family HTH domain